jgi:hypothetical protein
LFVLFLGGAFSQTRNTPPELRNSAAEAAEPEAGSADVELAFRGSYLSIKVAVIGPGDDLYLWWGHIGLVIEDALSGQTRFFDWGVFSFENENFYANFALGRLLYSCAVSSGRESLARILLSNRDITLYTLNLPPETKTEILLFAENNILPENRDYWYHHFKDNCATRVRDIIDRASGGAFGKAFKDAPGRFTLRGHVRRYTWFSPFWDWFFSFLMGRNIDRPITVWEEMFLPSEIALRIAGFTYTAPGGEERPLVSSVERLYRAEGRPGTLENPPDQWGGALLPGLGAALVLFVLKLAEFRFPSRRRFFSAVSALAQAALGLFFGAAGLILFFMTFFTNHDYTYHNANIIFVNPLLLAALPLGILAACGGGREKRAGPGKLLKLLWTCVFAGGIAAMALNLVPGLYQQNLATGILILPFAFTASAAPDLIAGVFPRLRKGRGG